MSRVPLSEVQRVALVPGTGRTISRGYHWREDQRGFLVPGAIVVGEVQRFIFAICYLLLLLFFVIFVH